MKAVDKKDTNAVDYFIKTDIDINYSFERQIQPAEEISVAKKDCKSEIVSAADIAYKNGSFDILFKLLMNNSRYPDKFEVNSASSDIKELVECTQEFHDLIKRGLKTQCKNFVNLSWHEILFQCQ
jgi:hypothetical protein